MTLKKKLFLFLVGLSPLAVLGGAYALTAAGLLDVEDPRDRRF